MGEDTCDCGEIDNAPINEPLINTDWKEIYYLYGCRNEGLPSKLYTEADVVYMKQMVEKENYQPNCDELLKSNGDTAVGAKVVTAEDTESTTVSKTDDTTVTKTDDTIKTDDTTETKTELKVVTADTTCIDVPEWKIDDAPFGYITCESLASSSSWSGLQCENGALVNPTFYYAKEAKESCCACGKE